MFIRPFTPGAFCRSLTVKDYSSPRFPVRFGKYKTENGALYRQSLRQAVELAPASVPDGDRLLAIPLGGRASCLCQVGRRRALAPHRGSSTRILCGQQGGDFGSPQSVQQDPPGVRPQVLPAQQGEDAGIRSEVSRGQKSDALVLQPSHK
jgi:hypothetical protein